MNVTAVKLKEAGFDPFKGPPCPYCKPQKRAVLKPAAGLYNDSTVFGNVWVCIDCYASVGTHKTGAWKDYPLGSLADNELKRVRTRAHVLFDHIWKTKRMTRTDAYKWLRKAMNTDEPRGHIGEFNLKQCHRAIDLMNKLLY